MQIRFITSKFQLWIIDYFNMPEYQGLGKISQVSLIRFY
jgi:hypothetical protein